MGANLTREVTIVRVFWALVGVLCVITIALLMKPGAPAPTALAGPGADVPPEAREQLALPPAPEPIPEIHGADAAPAVALEEAAETSAKVALLSEPAPQAATALPRTIEDLNTLLNLPPMPTENASPQGAEPAPPAGQVAASSGSFAKAASPEAVAPEHAPAPAAGYSTALSAETIAKFREVVPARVRAAGDGSTIFDERFPVRGQGTAESPYEITWDLLVSASETFQPRMGKLRMPERIAMLDGKHVRVTGYVAFPIMATSQNELLSMRNMWDGCCIGVPPTPYDAVEVKLAGVATGKDRFTSFGTVQGVLQVDPYIKGNWLLGLYLMQDASLTQIKEGVDPGKHGGM